MANNFNKTINLNVNATTGLKTLDELKVKSEELQKTIESLDITSIDFKNTRQELDAVNSKIKTFGQSSQEASDIATEAFVKTSQAIVGTTGTLLTFAASNDQADKVTAKLAKTLALVDSIEKISQATKAASIFLQDKANEATAAGVVQTGLFARAQAFLTTGINGVGTALKNLYVVLLANPFTAILATIGLVTAGIFAFTKSTQELIDEQQKLYEQTLATNDAIQEYNDIIRESLVLDEKRKNLRKGEELERRLAIDSIKEAQLKADDAILAKERLIAQERKAIVSSFYFSVFGFTTEQQQKFKDDEKELTDLKNARLALDNKLVQQQTKNSNDASKILNEDTQKSIQLRRAQLANFEDYATKLELANLDLQSAISDIQERELNGDKNTYTDRLIIRQNYNNAIAKLNKEEEQRIQAVYDKQVEIDEKFDAKEKALNDKRTNDELARQKAIDDNFDKRESNAEKNRTEAFDKLKNSSKEAFDKLTEDQEKALKEYRDQLQFTVDVIDKFSSILDDLGVDSGSGIRAINDGLRSLVSGLNTALEDGVVSAQEKIQIILETASEITSAVNEAIKATFERDIEALDKSLETLQEKRDLITEGIEDSISKQQELENKLTEARLGDREKILKAIDAERAREKQLAKDRLKSLEDEKKINEQKRELQKKAFIAEKIASLAQAGINIALGITTALINPVTAPVIVPLIAALGAIQIGVIAGTPIPEFKKGGPTRSSRSDSDVAGIVHANEYVIPAPIVRSPKFKSVINEIEKSRQTGSFQSGGFTSPENGTFDDRFDKVLQQSIALSERPIVVTVVDINNGQQRVAQVIDQATL